MSWAETYKINSNLNKALNKQMINSKFPEIIKLTNTGEIVIPQKGIYKVVLVSSYPGWHEENKLLTNVQVGISKIQLNVNAKVSFSNDIYKVSTPETSSGWSLIGCATLNISSNVYNKTMKVYDKSALSTGSTTASKYDLRPDSDDFVNIDEPYTNMPYIKELIIKDEVCHTSSTEKSDAIPVYSLFGLGKPYWSTDMTNRLIYATRGAILYPVEIL